jgi:UDP-glucose 4-epimerase
MKCLVTGGAGFIGRGVVKHLLAAGHSVLALDDLSNGRLENLQEFEGTPGFLGLMRGDLKEPTVLRDAFKRETWDLVLHLGASINVQGSIDDPEPTFRNDVEGTFRVLEACREQYFRLNQLDPAARQFLFDRDVPRLVDRRPRLAVMSTCMVYDLAADAAISEAHPYRASSPYAASKIAADNLALSYFHAYRMPVVVARPFNTYGPFQKSNSEGGVVSIFLKRDIEGAPLLVKGSGLQTRDFLYVDDCAEFVVACGMSEQAEGEVLNAGTGSEVTVKQLAELSRSPSNRVELVAHDHPQAEIMRLRCDPSKAQRLLGWAPRVNLTDGLARTRAWLTENHWAW